MAQSDSYSQQFNPPAEYIREWRGYLSAGSVTAFSAFVVTRLSPRLSFEPRGVDA